MFTFKKNLTIAIISTALITMSGGTFALSDDSNDYPCTIPDLSPEPVPPKVCFYTGINYTGNWYCESGERTVNKVNKVPWINNIESIKLFGDASVKIYNQYNRNGDYTLVEWSKKQLGSDFLNKVRSYRTVEPDNDSDEAVSTPTPSPWWDEMCRDGKIH